MYGFPWRIHGREDNTWILFFEEKAQFKNQDPTNYNIVK